MPPTQIDPEREDGVDAKLFAGYMRSFAERLHHSVAGDEVGTTEEASSLALLIGTAAEELVEKCGDAMNAAPALRQLVSLRVVHPTHFDFQRMQRAAQAVGARSGGAFDVRSFALFIADPRSDEVLRRLLSAAATVAATETGAVTAHVSLPLSHDDPSDTRAVADECWWGYMCLATGVDLRLALRRRVALEMNATELPEWSAVVSSHSSASPRHIITMIQSDAERFAAKCVVEGAMRAAGLHPLAPLNRSAVELVLNTCHARPAAAIATDTILADAQVEEWAAQRSRVMEHQQRMALAAAAATQRKKANAAAEQAAAAEHEKRQLQRRVSHRVLLAPASDASSDGRGRRSPTASRSVSVSRSPVPSPAPLRPPRSLRRREPTVADLIEHPIHDHAFGRRLDVTTPAEDRRHLQTLRAFAPRTAHDIELYGPRDHGVSEAGGARRGDMGAAALQRAQDAYGRSVASQPNPIKQSKARSSAGAEDEQSLLRRRAAELRELMTSLPAPAAAAQLAARGFLAPIDHAAATRRVILARGAPLRQSPPGIGGGSPAPLQHATPIAEVAFWEQRRDQFLRQAVHTTPPAADIPSRQQQQQEQHHRESAP